MKNINFKTQLLVSLILTVFFLYGGSTLLAQPWGDGPRNGKGPGPGARLNFDTEQKQALKKLAEEHREKMKTLRDDNQKLHDELFGLLKESQPDQTKADSLIALIAENRKKMDEAMFSHLGDIKNLCKTDEQRKLFNDFVDDFGKMHGPQQGPPPMEPPPPPQDK